MIASLQRIRLIAANTFLEAVRQKFFSALLLISVGLIFSASFFQQFDFGTNELKFIIDFGERWMKEKKVGRRNVR